MRTYWVTPARCASVVDFDRQQPAGPAFSPVAPCDMQLDAEKGPMIQEAGSESFENSFKSQVAAGSQLSTLRKGESFDLIHRQISVHVRQGGHDSDTEDFVTQGGRAHGAAEASTNAY